MKLLQNASTEALTNTATMSAMIVIVLILKILIFPEIWLGVGASLILMLIFIGVALISLVIVYKRANIEREKQSFAQATMTAAERALAESERELQRAKYDCDWVFCGISTEVPHLGVQILAANPEDLFEFWQSAVETHDGTQRFCVKTINIGAREDTTGTFRWVRKAAETSPNA